MAELQSIARPYAKAAFEYASSAGALCAWQNQLKGLSLVVSDAQVQELLADPKITNQQMAELFSDVLEPVLDSSGINFVNILAERGRLEALPLIYSQFQTLFEEQQRRVTAKVYVADALSSEQSQKIKQALQKRLKRDVELDIIIEPALYGGVRVQAKDLVIDGSVQGRLQKLFENLNAYS